MRIIGFGDIHMSLGQFQDIPGIESADAVILTGDLTHFGGADDAQEIVDRVAAVNETVFAQFGNVDNLDVDDYLQERGINIHGQARIVNDQCCLMGVGGSNITPFNYPVQFSEEEIGSFLDTAYTQARKLLASAQKNNLPLILVAHAPPIDTRLDELSNGTHVGSSAVRKFIETVQPAVCLTGHIHEAKGEDAIGSTVVINPGMICEGGWIDVTVENSTVKTYLT